MEQWRSGAVMIELPSAVEMGLDQAYEQLANPSFFLLLITIVFLFKVPPLLIDWACL